jgi:hypothetical protein
MIVALFVLIKAAINEIIQQKFKFFLLRFVVERPPVLLGCFENMTVGFFHPFHNIKKSLLHHNEQLLACK